MNGLCVRSVFESLLTNLSKPLMLFKKKFTLNIVYNLLPTCFSVRGHFSNPSGIYLSMCQTAVCVSTRLKTDHIKALRADVYSWSPWKWMLLPPTSFSTFFFGVPAQLHP